MSFLLSPGQLTKVVVAVVLVGAVVFAVGEFGSAPSKFSATPRQYSVSPSHPTVAARPHTVGAIPVDDQAMPTGKIVGWREVFSDDFPGESLDRSKWRLYEGQPGGDPGGWFSASHVSLSNGMLVISASRDPTRGNQWSTGGLSSSPGLVQTYGKYLVRFRMDAGIGVGHALVLFPADNSWPPEIDFSEDNGSGRDSTLGTVHYGATDKHVTSDIAVDLTQWHTLGVQWLPGSVVFTLDGRAWAHVDGVAVPKVPMTLDIQTETWPCSGTWGVCPDASTPKAVNLDVDWVVAYAPDGSASASGEAGATQPSSSGRAALGN